MNGDNLHEMSNPVFMGNIIKLPSAAVAKRVIKVNIGNILFGYPRYLELCFTQYIIYDLIQGRQLCQNSLASLLRDLL